MARRKAESPESIIPVKIADWLGGNRNYTGPSGSPWAIWTAPHSAMLPSYWREWKESNPEAVPPPGFAWLEDPNSRLHPPKWQVESAKKKLGLG